ncbi:uncharacterized protein PgNI_04454 [Pyricularia grisea]|uniref:Uncharacterized protein n=1 Tax=Pyricularia grisea TaxID=148305 RepID=A0A6P8BEH7_PYRGI|nr:uncharacterized protein PgNI_04454 [Pyricularia grisea]TLD14102.1 hypothetical protein PgNI_04454 [Pyricularia grisea]
MQVLDRDDAVAGPKLFERTHPVVRNDEVRVGKLHQVCRQRPRRPRRDADGPAPLLRLERVDEAASGLVVVVGQDLIVVEQRARHHVADVVVLVIKVARVGLVVAVPVDADVLVELLFGQLFSAEIGKIVIVKGTHLHRHEVTPFVMVELFTDSTGGSYDTSNFWPGSCDQFGQFSGSA